MVDKRWEVVIEKEIVRVAYASQCHKQHAGLRACMAQTHDDFVKRHTLCFPWRDGPSKAQRILSSFNVVILGALLFVAEGSPRFVETAPKRTVDPSSQENRR